MRIKKGYFLKIAFWAALVILFIGCGENAKGKDEKEARGIKTQSRMKLPDFSLIDLDGKNYQFIDYVGKKPILLAFWTTRCRFCTREIPRLNKIFTDRQDDLEFLSINLYEPPGMVRHFAKSKGIKYPVLLDQKGVTSNAYRIQGVPTFVVVDLAGGMRYFGHDLTQAMNSIGELVS